MIGGSVVMIGGPDVLVGLDGGAEVFVGSMTGVLAVGVFTVTTVGFGVREAGGGETTVERACLVSSVLRDRLVATSAVAVELFKGVLTTSAKSRSESSGVRKQRKPISSLAVSESAFSRREERTSPSLSTLRQEPPRMTRSPGASRSSRPSNRSYGYVL